MKNRTARILVTVFGGWFGLHRYLNHQIALGVLYTFTFGLFGIGWLVDICIACSSVSRKLSYVDSRKVPAVDSILHISAYFLILLHYAIIQSITSQTKEKIQ